MGRNVYTVTADGATAGLNVNGLSVVGQVPTNREAATTESGFRENTLVYDTHPMIEIWLAAGWIQRTVL